MEPGGKHFAGRGRQRAPGQFLKEQWDAATSFGDGASQVRCQVGFLGDLVDELAGLLAVQWFERDVETPRGPVGFGGGAAGHQDHDTRDALGDHEPE